MKLYYVYILRCSDGSFYIGITNNVENRLGQHNAGYDHQAYTYTRRPVELVYSEVFKEVIQAIAWEKQIKKWSRAKKEALIDGKWTDLHLLAECKNLSSHSNFNPESELT
jgi:putative endonuclease